MRRREFLKVAGTGVAFIVVGCGSSGGSRTAAGDGDGNGNGNGNGVVAEIELGITAALAEMVDGRTVYVWAFESPQTGPRFPGPVLQATEGDALRILVTNHLDEAHAFAVPGVVESPPIPPGETAAVEFTVPAAGTYLYIDPLNAPVNRVLGLHGALVALPAEGLNTPYSQPTQAVQRLFDDLGTTDHFPKHALSSAGWQRERTRIWLHHQIDPRFHELAESGTVIAPS